MRGAVWRRWAVVVGLAVVAVLAMTRPSPTDLTSTLPQNLGDPSLNTWILSWQWHSITGDPAQWWDGNIFHGSGSALGYSELMLPMLPLFGVVYAVTDNPVLAHNVVIVALLVFSLVATWALARRLGLGTLPAAWAAFAFTFSAYTFAHLGHLQLLSFGFFPLATLAVLNLVERRRRRDGVLVGLATAGLLTACLYYGAIWLVCLAVMVGLDVVVEMRRGSRAWRAPTFVAATSTAVLLAPVVLLFLQFQQETGFERAVADDAGLDPSDFLAPAAGSYTYRTAALASASRPAAVEHTFFVGLGTVALALAGLAVLVLVLRRRGLPQSAPTVARRPWALLGAAGLAAIVIALGPTVVGLPAPFRLLHAVAPGFDSIRVPARLAVPAVLLACLLAALGLQWLGGVLGAARVVPLAALAVAALELAAPFPRVDADPPPALAELYDAIGDLPAGAVAELPAATGSAGVAGVFEESPRMLYAIGDWRPRFNGTSGGNPPEYFPRVDVLNTFPSAASLTLLDELDIRYVVLKTATEASEFALTPAEVDALLGELTTGEVVARLESGTIVDLGAG